MRLGASGRNPEYHGYDLHDVHARPEEEDRPPPRRPGNARPPGRGGRSHDRRHRAPSGLQRAVIRGRVARRDDRAEDAGVRVPARARVDCVQGHPEAPRAPQVRGRPAPLSRGVRVHMEDAVRPSRGRAVRAEHPGSGRVGLGYDWCDRFDGSQERTDAGQLLLPTGGSRPSHDAGCARPPRRFVPRGE